MGSSETSASQIGHPQPVWRPSTSADHIPMNIYRAHINSKFRQNLRTSQELQDWSVRHSQEFWIDLWGYVGLIPSLPHATVRAYDPNVPISRVPKFFEHARLNYAENVLTGRDPGTIALIGLREGQSLEGEKWTWKELVQNVRTVRSALHRSRIKEGDRVAAVVSNSVWSITIFLAVASLAAVFTSIAPDLGEEGCISRLQQVTPSILFADSDITFKGRQKSNISKILNIVNNLKQKPEVFIIPLTKSDIGSFPTLSTFLSRSSPSDKLEFNRVSFSHPLYILYSSGTSGPPKCLVHQHGVIIQHRKISLLHNSFTPKDIVLQISSTSWVLWNIMIGHFSVGTTLITYDGSPLWPNPQAMLKILEYHKVTYYGTSPGYLQRLETTDCVPKNEFNLSSLRAVNTGGSHLGTDQYHWFYRVFAPHVHLWSVTGGTDLVTSWISADPAGPLYAGEMQLAALGMDMDCADPETGESIKGTGRAGEQITRTPFPSMPVFMWGDEGDEKYSASYFERFDFPCWAQHDWISFNPQTGGWRVHGRSDGVLNPSGIRFGSAEIYSVTESATLNNIISTTLCVGRRRQNLDTDESVFLFVVMHPGHPFTPSLIQRLRDTIRKGLSSRHVPKIIVEVPEIPLTVNGKKVEMLVKKIISTGDIPAVVSSTVVNPACLESFKRFYAVETERPKL